MNRKIGRKLLQKIIGKSIRCKRTEKKLTLTKLASMTDLDDKHLGRLERGEKLPNAKTLIKLQIALNFSFDDLIQTYMKEIKKHDNKFNHY